MRGSFDNTMQGATRQPYASIGLPVYNGQAYLAKAIESILAQTFTDFELIISDNASTDGTAAIAQSYAQRDPRIRYIRHQSNRGATWNFNHALTLARGRFFKWAAADDTIDPVYLQRCIEVFASHPEVIWVHTRSVKVDHQGRPFNNPLRPVIFDNRYLTPAQRLRCVLVEKGWVSRCSGLIRTEPLRQCRPLLPIYGSEKVMMAELILRGQYHEVCETLFRRRIHDQASGSLTSASQQQAFCDPSRRRRATFPRMQLLGGYLCAIFRAPLRIDDRFWSLLVILRYLLQIKKWARVFVGAILGRGTGGGNIESLRKLGSGKKEAGAHHPAASS